MTRCWQTERRQMSLHECHLGKRTFGSFWDLCGKSLGQLPGCPEPSLEGPRQSREFPGNARNRAEKIPIGVHLLGVIYRLLRGSARSFRQVVPHRSEVRIAAYSTSLQFWAPNWGHIEDPKMGPHCGPELGPSFWARFWGRW